MNGLYAWVMDCSVRSATPQGVALPGVGDGVVGTKRAIGEPTAAIIGEEARGGATGP